MVVKKTQKRVLTAAGVALLSVGLLAACGGGSDETVATVDGVPITKAEYDKWKEVATNSGLGEREAGEQAITVLIQQAWVEGEAAAKDVSISEAEVQEELANTKRQSFRTEAAYERFLEQAGLTEEDALERVRSSALLKKLKRVAQDEASGNSRQQLLIATSYFTNFQKRWRKKTECHEGYVVELCGNAPGS